MKRLAFNRRRRLFDGFPDDGGELQRFRRVDIWDGDARVNRRLDDVAREAVVGRGLWFPAKPRMCDVTELQKLSQLESLTSEKINTMRSEVNALNILGEPPSFTKFDSLKLKFLRSHTLLMGPGVHRSTACSSHTKIPVPLLSPTNADGSDS